MEQEYTVEDYRKLFTDAHKGDVLKGQKDLNKFLDLVSQNKLGRARRFIQKVCGNAK